MNNILLETILSGIAFGLSLQIFIISSMQIFVAAPISTNVPSFIIKNISQYGILMVILSGIIIFVTYRILKSKNSIISRSFFVLAGILGMIICGIQIILARGNFEQIGLAVLLIYICYRIVLKGLKR